MKRILSLILIVLALAAGCWAATENLDEIDARKSRVATSAWGRDTLEDASYLWQPETMQYTDLTTGHEVWRVSGSSGIQNFQQDISWPTYSGDGKYLTFISKRETYAHNSPYWDDNGTWFITKSDGSILRPLKNSPARSFARYSYFMWSPVEPDVFYTAGMGSMTGELNLSRQSIFRVTSGDNDETYTEHITGLPDLGGSNRYEAKKSFSADGTKIVYKGKYNDVPSFFPITVYPTASIDDADGWALERNWDTYWGDLADYSETKAYHDQYIGGTGSNIWFHIMPEGTGGSWMRVKLSGTAADGGPNFVQDQTSPYDWGGEGEYVNTIRLNSASEGDCVDTRRDPWCCDNDVGTQCANYFSHYTVDRWGKYVIFSNTDMGPEIYSSTGIWDIDAKQYEIEGFNDRGTQHHSWAAWSDWSASSTKGGAGFYDSQEIAIQNYTDIDSRKPISVAHIADDCTYQGLARPTQSPDGTKVVWHSTFLNEDTSQHIDVFYTVAYYPYAPEILSVTNGVVRFDWRTDQATSRGYTQRGWPDEATDDPPPPREIKAVRLWKSSNGVDGWTPVGTVTVDLWSRYNYSTGVWSGNKYFETTDSNPSGYYAVTAIEHSGLESRTLSNVFSAAGTQTIAYPADPGADSNIITAYNADCHRYYNIYAGDGSTPSIAQANRIASDSRSTKSFIDVFANTTSDNTRYTITAVDTQGNESTALESTIERGTALDGINTVSWTDELKTIVAPAASTVFRLGGGPGIGSGGVSLGGFPGISFYAGSAAAPTNPTVTCEGDFDLGQYESFEKGGGEFCTTAGWVLTDTEGVIDTYNTEQFNCGTHSLKISPHTTTASNVRAYITDDTTFTTRAYFRFSDGGTPDTTSVLMGRLFDSSSNIELPIYVRRQAAGDYRFWITSSTKYISLDPDTTYYMVITWLGDGTADGSRVKIYDTNGVAQAATSGYDATTLSSTESDGVSRIQWHSNNTAMTFFIDDMIVDHDSGDLSGGQSCD